MAVTTVTTGYQISNIFAVTAYPFQVGSQFPKDGGIRPYAWDDILHKPSLIFNLILFPILGVMIAMRGIK